MREEVQDYYSDNQLFFKTRWMTNEGFYFAEEELPNTALTDFLNGNEELKSKIIVLPFNQIKKATPQYQNIPPLLDIDVLDTENYSSLVADFGTKTQVEEAIRQIELKSGLKEYTEEISNKAWIRNLLYTIVIGFFGFALVMMAKEIEAGHELDLSGRRSGFKSILASIAEALGMFGCIALAAALFFGFAYFTFTTYKNSKKRFQVWKK